MFGCSRVANAVGRQGTLSYYEGPQADHRALYVDVNMSELLSHNTMDNKIQPPQARTLKTGNPESVALYHTKNMEYYEQHNMINRIVKLHRKHSRLSDDQVRKALEKWDLDQGRAMKFAEKQVKGTRLKKTTGLRYFEMRVSYADTGTFASTLSENIKTPHNLFCVSRK